MNEQWTEGRLAELRRVVDQMRHPTPWAASLEWFADRDLPGHLVTDLVRAAHIRVAPTWFWTRTMATWPRWQPALAVDVADEWGDDG